MQVNLDVVDVPPADLHAPICAYTSTYISTCMHVYMCMQVNLDVVDVPPDSSGGDCRCERGFYGRTCQKSAEILSSQSLELASAAVLYVAYMYTYMYIYTYM